MGGRSRDDMEREPLVSIVTPFYNTAEYLPECIESVLAQSHVNFEYLLVDNKSTDGSRRIAESYAARDSRIRVVENETFVDMLSNYNGALERIHPESRYVKIAQADDVLFPECVARMVALAEKVPTIGVVSSYYLMGASLCGEGLPREVSVLNGREACRRTILEKLYLTGSQTTVLYRADLVRSRRPFFSVGHDVADTEAVMDILLQHDFGFVHQVLSFSRLDDDSTMGVLRRRYKWMKVYFLALLEQYGRAVMSKEEFDRQRRRLAREYHHFLGREALGLPGRAFWQYHRRRLAQVGRRLRWMDVWPWALLEILRAAASPGRLLEGAVKRVLEPRRRIGGRGSSGADASRAGDRSAAGSGGGASRVAAAGRPEARA
jgi:glycosyltransferase involved in cell wall biosynthesis